MLSCFDRMLFRGYLPIMSGWQMAQFFNSSKIRFRELKGFLLQHANGSNNTPSMLPSRRDAHFNIFRKRSEKKSWPRKLLPGTRSRMD